MIQYLVWQYVSWKELQYQKVLGKIDIPDLYCHALYF